MKDRKKTPTKAKSVTVMGVIGIAELARTGYDGTHVSFRLSTSGG